MTNGSSDSLREWIDFYLQMAVRGVRSEGMMQKITLHLNRFRTFFMDRYGQESLQSCVKRDVVAWQIYLLQSGFAHSTVNNHLASLSAFATWVESQNNAIFPMGDPTKGIHDLPLPPLEPRALNADQVRSLKNLCDRLLPFYRVKGRKWSQHPEDAPLRAKARPWRDRGDRICSAFDRSAS